MNINDLKSTEKQKYLGHVLELSRDDLLNNKINTPFDEISIHDFNRGIITMELIRKSIKIIFIDGNQTKVFKDIKK